MLDGACEIERLVGRVKELEMPAVAMTDHGNIFGAVIVRQCRQRSGCEADPRLRALHLQEGRPSRRARGRHLQPPHRAGRKRSGLSQPGEDRFRSFAARLLLQAAHQQEISRRTFAGTDRPLSLSEGRSRRAPDGREVRSGARGRRQLQRHLRQRQFLSRDSGPGRWKKRSAFRRTC